MRLRFLVAAPFLLALVLASRGQLPITAPATIRTADVIALDDGGVPDRAERTIRLTSAQQKAQAERDSAFLAAAAEAQRAEAERAKMVKETGARSASGPASPGPEPAPAGDALTAIANNFGDVYDKAVRVADCESSLDPTNVSPGGGNWGLFQINRAAHEADFVQFAKALLDDQQAPADDPRRTFTGGTRNAELNAAYARKLYDGSGGWGPWSCRYA